MPQSVPACLYALVQRVAGPVLDAYVDPTLRDAAEQRLRISCGLSSPIATDVRLGHHTGSGRARSVPIKRETDLEERYSRLRSQYQRLRALLSEVLAGERTAAAINRLSGEGLLAP